MRATAMTAVLLALLATTTAAQPVNRVGDVGQRVHAGDRVQVVDASGRATSGRLTRVTADDLAIEDDAGLARAFAAADITRIARRGDALGNGMRRGAIIGGVLGGALGAGFSGEFRAADLLQGVALFGGAGLAIGLGIDAANVGWTTVYAAPSVGTRAGNRAAGRTAVRASLRW